MSNWDFEKQYIDFKTIEDRDRCIAWIESLLSSQTQSLIEKIEEMKEGFTKYIVKNPITGETGTQRELYISKSAVLSLLKGENK